MIFLRVALIWFEYIVLEIILFSLDKIEYQGYYLGKIQLVSINLKITHLIKKLKIHFIILIFPLIIVISCGINCEYISLTWAEAAFAAFFINLLFVLLFAKIVFCLVVARCSSVNPSLWNSWLKLVIIYVSTKHVKRFKIAQSFALTQGVPFW